VTLPALALVMLVVPYLPFAADAFPPLQILAGPARIVVWLVVAAQLGWVLWRMGFVHVSWAGAITPMRAALAAAGVTLIVSGAAAAKLTGTVLFPSGDEPHYLVIAQSIWRDGDFKIENNHTRQDYKEYFKPDLDPHFLTRGKDGEIYSIHPVGMPVLMAPVYAAGGYRAVVAAFVLMAAVAAGLMTLVLARVTGTVAAALFAWAAVALTPPFLFNSFAIYPEIPAALAVVLAFTLATGRLGASTLPSWLAVGVCAAALPWLSTKYAPMSAALVAVALARAAWPWRRDPNARAGTSFDLGRTALPALAIVVPYLVSLAGWFGFFYWIWGTPWPQAPYGALVQTQIFNLTFGAPGLFFDQEYGLLPYAPVFALAATGLWILWREGGERRRTALEIVVVLAGLVGTVGAFRIWWGGTASPGRPITSGLWLLALPIAVAFQAAPADSARRAAHHLLLWLSIGIAGVMLFAEQGFLIANGRDGTSSLLEYLSPRWPAWSMAPSFIYHEPLTALAHTAVWLLLAAVSAAVLSKVRTNRASTSSLAAIGVIAVAFIAGVGIVPHLPATPEWPGVDVRARARTPLLDDFDRVARPVGVEYDPLSVVAATDVTGHSALEVRPDSRLEPQPIRVLHNGRVSLPAGKYRLDIDWSGTRHGEKLGLQLGRTGEPWRTWEVEPRPGEHWSTDFTLPVNAGFVGLRGTPELERNIARIAFVPVSVIDLGRRPRLPELLGASFAPGADYFYFDENALPEATGFWIRGARTTHVTIQREQRTGPLRLRLNSGLIANRLRISAPGWAESVALEAKMPTEIEVPMADRSLVTLELTADHEFIPRALDPASLDPRTLGIWVEVVAP